MNTLVIQRGPRNYYISISPLSGLTVMEIDNLDSMFRRLTEHAKYLKGLIEGKKRNAAGEMV